MWVALNGPESQEDHADYLTVARLSFFFASEAVRTSTLDTSGDGSKRMIDSLHTLKIVEPELTVHRKERELLACMM